MGTSTASWIDANQRCLTAAIAIVRERLDRHAAADIVQTPDIEAGSADRRYEQAAADLPAPSALDHLCHAFGLSSFERDIVLLCCGVELDSAFAAACARAQGNPQRPYPTFGLALAALADPHWDALIPSGMLRRWRLVESSGADGLVNSRLRIDERILHYLTGISYLDERLHGLVEPIAPPSGLLPSHEQVAGRIAAVVRQQGQQQMLPIINLCGPDRSDLQAVAARAFDQLGLRTFVVDAANIPASPAEREALARLWEREAILSQCGLVLIPGEHQRACQELLALLRGVLVVASREPIGDIERLVVRLDLPKPTPSEQQTLWQAVLGAGIETVNGQLDGLTAQFNLSQRAIHSACAQFREARERNPDARVADALWNVCRIQARQKLDDLARRIEPVARWDDLVLAERHIRTLREIAAQVRHRATVYDRWGFARKGQRGLGITALFAGPSGTGKTMAAEVLANELTLDLYHIDLSQVVSKYIGETEKNLKRVFDAAEDGGAVLLFDEADALFGKRTEVKDSHDRYANIEVSYLLQRMEAYRGLAILTTNQRSSLDAAFQRRIRFEVNFPFPDAAERARIWQRIFPDDTPTDRLDVEKLARLHIAGGNIRNIALYAAFLAADRGEPVRMHHLLRAAQTEYTKIERSLTDADTRGWV
jgi:hypothetical protein